MRPRTVVPASTPDVADRPTARLPVAATVAGPGWRGAAAPASHRPTRGTGSVARRQTGRLAYIALALTASVGLAACGSGGDPDPPATRTTALAGTSGPRTTYPLTVENCGRNEVFPAAPKRAVAVAQPVIEELLALGLQDRMAGTASWSDPVLPSLARANAAVPRLSDRFPSLERVLKAEPDFVATTFDYTFTAEGIADRDRFTKLGIPTYQSAAECGGQESTQARRQTMQDTYAEIGDMARIFDVQDRGTKLIASLKARMAKASGGVRASDVSVAWWYSDTKAPYMAGCCGAAGIVSRELGAKNAFEDADQLFPQVSWEAILKRDPTVLVLADLTRGNDGDSLKAKLDFLQNDPVARRLTAVRKRRFVVVTGSEMDQSIRNVDATEKLAAGLRRLGLAGTPTPSVAPTRTTYPLTIRDNCGRTVTVDAAPKRAVSVNQGSTEILLSLGLADRMVGTATWTDRIRPNLAAANAKVPRLGDDAVSFERILKTEPDLVSASFAFALNGEDPDRRDRFAKLGVPTYLAPSHCENRDDESGDGPRSRPLKLSTIQTEIRQLAAIFDVRPRGEALAADLQRRLDRVRAANADRDPSKVSIAYWFANTESPYVAGCCGSSGIISAAAGVRNVFADTQDEFPQVSWETVLDRDPTVLVLGDLQRESQTGDKLADKIRFLETDPVARRLTAVRRKRYVILNGADMNPSIRTVDGAEKVSAGIRKLGLVE